MISNIYNKYDQSTLSKFDIIGSYFVNLYYNEFYIKSKNLKFDNAYNSTTEAYKNVLSSYLEFTKKAEFFNDFFRKLAGQTTLQQQIQDGWSSAQIKASWAQDIEQFKKTRAQYLLYP